MAEALADARRTFQVWPAACQPAKEAEAATRADP